MATHKRVSIGVRTPPSAGHRRPRFGVTTSGACPKVARLCRTRTDRAGQLCAGSADVDLFSYFNAIDGRKQCFRSTPPALLWLSHDYLRVLHHTFFRNERDPHTPARIASEELPELGQG